MTAASIRLMINGVHYNLERAGNGPPLVLLHGFTGSLQTWTAIMPRLAQEFDTIAVDLLGHGATDAPSDAARYRAKWVVADLVAMLDHLGIRSAAWLGYSMGGRAALHVAIEHPGRVSALVLEGVSPGIADPIERAERLRSDEALADVIESEGVAAFVDRWERLPLFTSQARLPDEVREALRRQRLANTAVGLANSLRGFGQGAQRPLHDRLGDVRAPTLLIVGSDDDKFQRLAQEMTMRMPKARVEVVPEAGHAAHLEQPARFVEIVSGFLREQRLHAMKEEQVR
jgi:2-succinyl-6-hydroxy-2,4-cyclohexadiene-1-carboxylate synthase